MVVVSGLVLIAHYGPHLGYDPCNALSKQKSVKAGPTVPLPYRKQ